MLLETEVACGCTLDGLADGITGCAGHCTGWRGKAALAAALPGRYMTCVVGATYTFRGTERS